MKNLIRRLIPVFIGLIFCFFVIKWPAIQFEKITLSDLTTRLSILLFFSLLIERAVEIWMSIWRSEEANKREATLNRLIENKVPNTDKSYTDAEASLIEYKAETLRWTMPISFTFGLIVAALGLRCLSQFVDVRSMGADYSIGTQLWWFNMMDILFTAALLAGGADPIHKLMDLYRKFIESSASRATRSRA